MSDIHKHDGQVYDKLICYLKFYPIYLTIEDYE